MLSKVLSGAVSGINGYAVNVEVDISNGFPCFEIVGLPGPAGRICEMYNGKTIGYGIVGV